MLVAPFGEVHWDTLTRSDLREARIKVALSDISFLPPMAMVEYKDPKRSVR